MDFSCSIERKHYPEHVQKQLARIMEKEKRPETDEMYQFLGSEMVLTYKACNFNLNPTM
jgi:hypothetical protein